MTPDNPNDANKPVIDHDPRPVTPGVPDDRGAAPQSLFAEPAKSPADAKAAAKDAARAREAADAKAAADRKAAKAQPPVRVRGGGSNLLTLFLFAVLGGGLYYVWAFPKPGQEDATAELRQQLQDESNRIAALQTEEQGAAQQVQTLSDRVEKLEKAPPPAPEPAPAAEARGRPDRQGRCPRQPSRRGAGHHANRPGARRSGRRDAGRGRAQQQGAVRLRQRKAGG
jgi:hypothetical protein